GRRQPRARGGGPGGHVVPGAGRAGAPPPRGRGAARRQGQGVRSPSRRGPDTMPPSTRSAPAAEPRMAEPELPPAPDGPPANGQPPAVAPPAVPADWNEDLYQATATMLAAPESSPPGRNLASPL